MNKKDQNINDFLAFNTELDGELFTKSIVSKAKKISERRKWILFSIFILGCIATLVQIKYLLTDSVFMQIESIPLESYMLVTYVFLLIWMSCIKN